MWYEEREYAKHSSKESWIRSARTGDSVAVRRNGQNSILKAAWEFLEGLDKTIRNPSLGRNMPITMMEENGELVIYSAEELRETEETGKFI
jgi:hypothetical protein